MKIIIPEEIKKINNVFCENNLDLYLVGGFVRDSIVGLKTNDIDLVTDALPNQVIQLLKKYKLDTFHQNIGVVSFKIDRYNVTIATMREEGGASNGRLPTKINFINDLLTDLKRRDYTINAITCNFEGEIIDLIGGKVDLDNKRLCIIGDPNVRFVEDPLRILRGLRFACKLNLTIDEKLVESLAECGHLLNNLSIGTLFLEIKKQLELDNVFTYLTKYKMIYQHALYFIDIELFYQLIDSDCTYYFYLYIIKRSIKNCYVNNAEYSKYEKRQINIIDEILCFNSKKILDAFIIYQKYDKLIDDNINTFLRIKNYFPNKDYLYYLFDNILKIKNDKLLYRFEDLAIDKKYLLRKGYSNTLSNKIFMDIYEKVITKQIENKPSSIEEYIKSTM